MRLLWILIPLAGIAFAAFSEWLKFKRQTTSIGESTTELSTTVETLRKEITELRQERSRLVLRLQNLETIVTSEGWETLGSDPELTKSRLLDIPPQDEDDQQRVERIARRLRG